MTTKEQERKALAKIREIVDGLGENSYIGIAFEGCFEDAEENIENDFGCSMKQRAESAEKKLSTAELDIRDLRSNIAELKQKCANLEGKVLSTADAGTIKAILISTMYESEQKAQKAAQRIVENAEHPNSADFQQAVTQHRAFVKEQEKAQELIQKLIDTMR